MQVSIADSQARGTNHHKGALLSSQLRSSNPFFFIQRKEKFRPLRAAQRSDTTILIQLLCQNDLKINQKFSKVMIRRLTHGHQLSSGERVENCTLRKSSSHSLRGVHDIRPALLSKSGTVQCWTLSSFQVYWRRVSHQEVALLVQSQVVRAGEAALAVRALERLDACVFSEVSRQFIRTSKLPCAAFPHALVRFLTWIT